MTNIIISGISGKMGNIVYDCVMSRNDCKVIAGVDVADKTNMPVPIYKNAQEITLDADVLIDFSHPSALDGILEYATKTKTALVLCATGYSSEQVDKIKKTACEIAVFYSGNMSLGINLLIDLAKRARNVFGDTFDVEIIEKHHNQKIDAPSGTAFMIADAISSVSDNDMKYVYDRHSVRKKRNKSEIGLHSVRGGTIVGEHEVIFAGRDETFSIKHQAQSKEVFAVGAVSAAVFMKEQNPGLYNMGDVLLA